VDVMPRRPPPIKEVSPLSVLQCIQTPTYCVYAT
jgi:hypothetical protein